MSHAYVSNLMHCIFSTKERVPLIDLDLESRLWPYLGGIARQNEMKALAIGGTTDHLHTLLSLPGTMAVSKAMQLLKGGSSKWVHEAFPMLSKFSWQEGYGAFSVSLSQVDKAIASNCTLHAGLVVMVQYFFGLTRDFDLRVGEVDPSSAKKFLDNLMNVCVMGDS